MDILSFFSKGGSPATGLTPTIQIKDINGVLLVDGEDMIEVADGFYKYTFDDVNEKENYLVISDGGDDDLDSRLTYWGGQLIEQVSSDLFVENNKSLESYIIGANRGTEAILQKLSKETGNMFTDLTNNIKEELGKQKPKELVERVVEKEKVVIENKIDTEKVVENIIEKLKKEEDKEVINSLLELFDGIDISALEQLMEERLPIDSLFT